jgi:hypothetical protein
MQSVTDRVSSLASRLVSSWTLSPTTVV